MRFARYAFRFEMAYRYNNWDDVKRCFHSDISYVIDGKFPFEGTFKGAQNVIEALQKSVNEFDKNFDKRVPVLTKIPFEKNGVVFMEWKVKYYINHNVAFVLYGVSETHFINGKIILLKDSIPYENCERGKAYYDRFNHY